MARIIRERPVCQQDRAPYSALKSDRLMDRTLSEFFHSDLKGMRGVSLMSLDQKGSDRVTDFILD